MGVKGLSNCRNEAYPDPRKAPLPYTGMVHTFAWLFSFFSLKITSSVMHLKCVTIQMKTFSLLSTITSYYNLDVFNLNWNLPAIYYNSDLQDLSAFLPDSKLDATLIATILWARTSCIGAPRTITLPYFLPFSFFTIFSRKSTLFFIWHNPFSFACPLTGLPQLLLFNKKIWSLMPSGIFDKGHQSLAI